MMMPSMDFKGVSRMSSDHSGYGYLLILITGGGFCNNQNGFSSRETSFLANIRDNVSSC